MDNCLISWEDAKNRLGCHLPASEYPSMCLSYQAKEEKYQIWRKESNISGCRQVTHWQHYQKINYPDWLTNVVLVKKCSGKWRMWETAITSTRLGPKAIFFPPRLINSLIRHQRTNHWASWMPSRLQPNNDGRAWWNNDILLHRSRHNTANSLCPLASGMRG